MGIFFSASVNFLNFMEIELTTEKDRKNHFLHQICEEFDMPERRFKCEKNRLIISGKSNKFNFNVEITVSSDSKKARVEFLDDKSKKVEINDTLRKSILLFIEKILNKEKEKFLFFLPSLESSWDVDLKKKHVFLQGKYELIPTEKTQKDSSDVILLLSFSIEALDERIARSKANIEARIFLALLSIFSSHLVVPRESFHVSGRTSIAGFIWPYSKKLEILTKIKKTLSFKDNLPAAPRFHYKRFPNIKRPNSGTESQLFPKDIDSLLTKYFQLSEEKRSDFINSCFSVYAAKSLNNVYPSISLIGLVASIENLAESRGCERSFKDFLYEHTKLPEDDGSKIFLHRIYRNKRRSRFVHNCITGGEKLQKSMLSIMDCPLDNLHDGFFSDEHALWEDLNILNPLVCSALVEWLKSQ